MGLDSDDLAAARSGATSVLVRAPGMADERDAVCADLVAPGDADAVRAVAVVLQGPPSAWVDRWRERTDASLADLRAVAVTDGRVPVGDVEVVDSPGDLTGLELAVADALTSFADGEPSVALCFDSLTTLLQYAETAEAFRFLHALTERLWSVGAVGHFHVDPAAHEERTLSRLVPLFDAAVTHDDGWTVRRRPLAETDKG